MKLRSSSSLLLAFAIAGALGLSLPAIAQEHSHPGATAAKPSAGQLIPVTDKDAAWVAKAKAEYPTTTCVVSDDKLGADMGKPADFIYRQEGKPDRLISFCCKDCVKDFNADPQKYLKMLDDASAAKKKAAPGHQH
jgi:YHS domain-containing protein